MPRRTLIELAHAIAGLLVTLALVELAAWAYPLGRRTIVAVGWAAAAAVALLAVAPLRRAWAADRAGE